MTKGDGFGDWYVTVKNKPIVKNDLEKIILADSHKDVVVKVDNRDGKGFMQVPVTRVIGQEGKIFIIFC